jgi:hypothetical protein
VSTESTLQRKQLVLIELNELNLDLIESYVRLFPLPNFERLLAGGMRRTSSESRYELLEPWIQWVSVHTGLDANEHGVFRLGDFVNSSAIQIFEQLERAGLSVGAISPMNAANRLAKPAYFLPDPWTKTATDGSFWSRILADALSQAVNDNSRARISLKSGLALVAGLARFARVRNYATYARLALTSRGRPWRKALFLDLFLNDIHLTLFQKHRPNFSTLFLNAGAHIQHHYFFNSRAKQQQLQNPRWYVDDSLDPLAEAFRLYDRILGDYIQTGAMSTLVATGLTQLPYDEVEFYYRLKNHEVFLRRLGLNYIRVLPRMTRDFVVECETSDQAAVVASTLSAVIASSDGARVFAEIDNRGTTVFASLTYPKEIDAAFAVSVNGKTILLSEHVVFVAIKNGMHDARGFFCAHGTVAKFLPASEAHVKSFHSTILSFFDVK